MSACLYVSICNRVNRVSYVHVYFIHTAINLDFRESFEAATSALSQIQKWQNTDYKPVILVANKSDLVRSRCISKQGTSALSLSPLAFCLCTTHQLRRHCADGRQIAIDYNCKYIETSCTISLNIDFLLAGIGAQINLRSSGKKKGTVLLAFSSCPCVLLRQRLSLSLFRTVMMHSLTHSLHPLHRYNEETKYI